MTEGAAPTVKKIPPAFSHNTLPSKGHFERNAPARRSAAVFKGPEPMIEYFVPRSISEFDLSIACGDAPISRTFLPLTVRAPRRSSTANQRPRSEKMVTFEDEQSRKSDVATTLDDVFM